MEILFGFAGEADDEARTDRDVGCDRAPRLQPFEHLCFVRRALHRLQNLRARVLEGDVQIRRQQPLGHQRDHRIDVRIGIDIVEPHPRRATFAGAKLAEFAGEVGHVRTHFMTLPFARLVPDIDAIGRGVLADHQQLLRPCRDELFSLAQHRVDAAADELAAQIGDDAEGAAVIAAFADLQIAVVARCELQPAFGDQINEWPLSRRRRLVDRVDNLFILMRAGDREDVGETRPNDLRLVAHAAGDDDAAILRHRLADRLQAFLLRAVEEAAGVDEHYIGARIVGRQAIAVGAQFGQNPFAVDECLRTAERNHADFRLGGEGLDCHDRPRA